MAEENKNSENQEERIEPGNEAQNVVDSAQNIIDTAMKGVAIKDEKESMLGGVGDSFKGLPMSELIGAPLLAAAEAQRNLAGVAWEFYQKMAYETDDSGKPKLDKTRVLKFNLNRPLEVDGEMKNIEQTVEAPFIGLLPIPSLLIDRIDVDFQMEVTDNNVTTTKDDKSAEAEIGGRKFGVTAKIGGKVSSSRENTRTTNQSAKYNIHVSASQQPATEGLSKLMDVMASCIEPMTVK